MPNPGILKTLNTYQIDTTKNHQNKQTLPIHKTIQNQMNERREKGLCYYCDTKWTLGHKCQNPKLYLLEEVLLDSDINGGLEEEICDKKEETQAIFKVPTAQTNPKISLDTIT